jgi:hypothetical protein
MQVHMIIPDGASTLYLTFWGSVLICLSSCRYEQAKITTLVAETGLHFHLGLKYNPNSQSFEWVSGEEFTYAHWAEFEPGDTLGRSLSTYCM